VTLSTRSAAGQRPARMTSVARFMASIFRFSDFRTGVAAKCAGHLNAGH
jgi:hypothetical protein